MGIIFGIPIVSKIDVDLDQAYMKLYFKNQINVRSSVFSYSLSICSSAQDRSVAAPFTNPYMTYAAARRVPGMAAWGRGGGGGEVPGRLHR